MYKSSIFFFKWKIIWWYFVIFLKSRQYGSRQYGIRQNGLGNRQSGTNSHDCRIRCYLTTTISWPRQSHYARVLFNNQKFFKFPIRSMRPIKRSVCSFKFLFIWKKSWKWYRILFLKDWTVFLYSEERNVLHLLLLYIFSDIWSRIKNNSIYWHKKKIYIHWENKFILKM